ncbi:MAG: flagellar hook-basal body complex protein FliE [Acidobacteriaceae bacterium]
MQPTTIPFLSAFAAPAVLAPSMGSPLPASEPSAPFGNLLKNAVTGIDGLEQQASSAVEGVLQGTGVDVHDAMIATQKADMSFELALAVRNKAVAAYQQVMGMQF